MILSGPRVRRENLRRRGLCTDRSRALETIADEIGNHHVTGADEAELSARDDDLAGLEDLDL